MTSVSASQIDDFMPVSFPVVIIGSEARSGERALANVGGGAPRFGVSVFPVLERLPKAKGRRTPRRTIHQRKRVALRRIWGGG